jgi:ubiquinone/menaquinone biosynthesis C-methylase UbiE
MSPHSRVREEFARQAESLSVAPAFTDTEVLEKIRAATSPTKDMQILDLGCGPGIVSAALAPYAREVVAFDLTPEMLEKARQRCQEAGLRNVRFELGRAEELPFEAGSFDAVVTRLTLHHFPDPHRAVVEMVRVTRPKGKVVVADIVSSENPDEAELHNSLEILRDPSHVRAFSTGGLLNLIESAGLRVTSRSTWEMQRDFDEWIRITNAPERVKPLYTVMLTLARAGIHAGIDLRFNGKTVVFKHRWLLVATEKITSASAP